jgi:hypothetical protein
MGRKTRKQARPIMDAALFRRPGATTTRRLIDELGLGTTKDDPTSCEWHADNQLLPEIAARTMFQGMIEGWFRTKDGKPETLTRYFDADTDDPYNARGIINGDKSKVPSWSGGVSIGNLIKGYHNAFLNALEASVRDVEDVEESRLEQVPRGALPDMTEGGVYDVYFLRVSAGAKVELFQQSEVEGE